MSAPEWVESAYSRMVLGCSHAPGGLPATFCRHCGLETIAAAKAEGEAAWARRQDKKWDSHAVAEDFADRHDLSTGLLGEIEGLVRDVYARGEAEGAREALQKAVGGAPDAFADRPSGSELSAVESGYEKGWEDFREWVRARSRCAAVTRAEQTEALWQWILAACQGTGWFRDIDGASLQEKATELGLLRKEPYDPAAHGEQDAEPGDDWYVPVTP